MAISLAKGWEIGAKPRSHVNAPAAASSSRVPPSQQPTKRRACPTTVRPAICLPMTTRAAARVFVALFLASVVSLRAQEHPRAPQQSQSQQLPQSAKGAPQAAMTEATMSRSFRRTEEIHQRLRSEIRRQEVSYAISAQKSRVGLGQSPR